jgi:protein ImuB
MATALFACLWSSRTPAVLMEIARDFSPRIQRHGGECVVLDVGGLGRLLGAPGAIGDELARAAARHSPADAVGRPVPSNPDDVRPRLRFTSRYGIRIEPHPVEHATLSIHPAVGGMAEGSPPPTVPVNPRPLSAVTIAIAPTQISAVLLALGRSSALTVVTDDIGAALAPLPLRALQQAVATIRSPGWPAPIAYEDACEDAFDVLRRWGLTTIGEFASLPATDLSARMGTAGVALHRLARGIDARPLVPDPGVPRYREQMELEWPIDTLEPLSFVLARLLDSLSLALERADRGAAAIRLDLRLVDRTCHSRMLQLPVAMRDARVLRTLLLLDLESHPPPAAIDVVTIEIDPAPGRVLQYSLLERALPSAETIATLMARLSALVGESRCGAPVLLDSYRPDAFALERFAPPEIPVRGRAGRAISMGAAAAPPHSHVPFCLRRYRPPVAVRVTAERDRPTQVAIDRRGMPGGQIVQAAGPWRSSGEWWHRSTRHWDHDEWDVSFSDGASCRLYRERDSGRWFVEGVFD